MPADPSPTVRRRRLGAELRRLRENAGLTAGQAAGEMDCHASKIGRIENGRSGVRLPDLRAMLDLYGVGDGPARDTLTALAREGRERGWWHLYAGILTPAASEYVSLEAAASTIRNFETVLVPGLLQTGEYTRAVVREGRPDESPEQTATRVRLRTERQLLLRRPGAPLLHAVVGEAALHVRVGGRDVMAEQIAHLLAVSDRPNVTLQVVPFTAGAHPGLDGPFVVLGFPEPHMREVVLVEGRVCGIHPEDDGPSGGHGAAFERIRTVALGPEGTREMLRGVLAGLRGPER